MMNEEYFVKLREKVLSNFGGKDGHGIGHTDRVYKLALNISEGMNVDMDVVRAAALLHDVARSRENKKNSIDYGGEFCHAVEGVKMACKILEENRFPFEKIDSVAHAIEVHRYSKGLEAKTMEAMILQDADRLDALGATIVVRMVKACVEHELPIYDPSIPIKDEYDGSKLTLINHVYEKLLKITPDSFKTAKAREIARGRYGFVKEFAERYVGEVEGKC